MYASSGLEGGGYTTTHNSPAGVNKLCSGATNKIARFFYEGQTFLGREPTYLQVLFIGQLSTIRCVSSSKYHEWEETGRFVRALMRGRLQQLLLGNLNIAHNKAIKLLLLC